jgi:hypothetical protein
MYTATVRKESVSRNSVKAAASSRQLIASRASAVRPDGGRSSLPGIDRQQGGGCRALAPPPAQADQKFRLDVARLVFSAPDRRPFRSKRSADCKIGARLKPHAARPGRGALAAEHSPIRGSVPAAAHGWERKIFGRKGQHLYEKFASSC